MKKSLFLFVAVVVIAISIWWLWSDEAEAPTSYESFEECAAAGNPVAESYPRQCFHGTTTYFEDIKNPVNASSTNGKLVPQKPSQPSGQPRACTMEAKQCPDGSYVGRTGPNCEFTPCP